MKLNCWRKTEKNEEGYTAENIALLFYNDDDDENKRHLYSVKQHSFLSFSKQ